MDSTRLSGSSLSPKGQPKEEEGEANQPVTTSSRVATEAASSISQVVLPKTWLQFFFGGFSVRVVDPIPGKEKRDAVPSVVANQPWADSSTSLANKEIEVVATPAEAQRQLRALTERTLRSGSLRVLGTGGELHVAYNWFDFTFGSSEREEQDTKASEYVTSLVRKAYLGIPEEKVSSLLSNYLGGKKNLKVQDLRDLRTNAEQQEQQEQQKRACESDAKNQQELAQRLSQQGVLGFMLIQAEDLLEDFFKKESITVVRKVIGTGAFGNVYSATKGTEDYVVKVEKQLRLLPSGELNPKPWRDGDIAASRVKDISHFAKTEFFILRIKLPGARFSQRWHVQTDKIKEFLQALLNAAPEAEVAVEASLMKRAPGKELFDHLYTDKIDLSGDFLPIAKGLFSFLQTTYERNFVHLDLKPENIMYDRSKQELTVIDAGLGQMLRRRGKTPSGESNPNPSFSTRTTGTLMYMHPRVWKEEAYDSSVDFYSAGLVLLEVLGGPKARQLLERILTRKSKQFLDTSDKLVNFIKDFRNEQLQQKLTDDKDAKKIIELFFAVGRGDQGAFEKLEAHMAVLNQQASSIVVQTSVA